MLTGDKMETAENIAKSCRLIQPDFTVLRLKLNSKLPRADNPTTLTQPQND
jgi:magnesium-transporting ATPase (P-type)